MQHVLWRAAAAAAAAMWTCLPACCRCCMPLRPPTHPPPPCSALVLLAHLLHSSLPHPTPPPTTAAGAVRGVQGRLHHHHRRGAAPDVGRAGALGATARGRRMFGPAWGSWQLAAPMVWVCAARVPHPRRACCCCCCALTSLPHPHPHPHPSPPIHPQYYKLREPRRWATSGGLGSMGFGLPSALGAAAAFDGKNGRPHKIVVDIDGDGRWVGGCAGCRAPGTLYLAGCRLAGLAAGASCLPPCPLPPRPPFTSTLRPLLAPSAAAL